MTGPIKILNYGEAQKIEFLDSLNFRVIDSLF